MNLKNIQIVNYSHIDYLDIIQIKFILIVFFLNKLLK